MKNLLSDNPVIGAISGLGSGALYAVKQILTDDNIIRYVAGIGVWTGLLIAVLTLYLKILEIKKIKSKK